MRDVLLQLEMASNGSTSTFDSSGGGTPDYVLIDEDGRPRFGVDDAPHLYYRAKWNAAGDDDARTAVLTAARKTLDSIRRSHADRTAAETKEQLAHRIVNEGEGWPARDVANSMRCGIRMVWASREAAGRDVEYGKPQTNGRELSRDERNAVILRMHRQRMSGHQIAAALNIERSSVRYVLARALRASDQTPPSV